MTEYILIGSGGFSMEVAEYLSEVDSLSSSTGDTKAIVSDIVSTSKSRFDDICSLLGYQPKLHDSPNMVTRRSDKKALICLGCPDARHKNLIELKGMGFKFGTFIHPSAWVAQTACIGEGAIVCPFAFIGAKARLEPNIVVNARATVGHDVSIGASSVLSPHCDMNGASKCGQVSFLGAGAILDPSAEIGDYSKVASGSVVKQKFGDGFLLSGNPAKGRQMFKVGNTEIE